jgi:hypothetical protein
MSKHKLKQTERQRAKKEARKGYLSTPRPRFVPDPEKLFQELKDLKEPVRFVHPITGEWVTYQRET